MDHTSLERARDRLRHRGIRLTRARSLVLDALHRSPGPRSAADLHRAVQRRVPLSSLYRALTDLAEAGALDRFLDATGVARYELAEEIAGHHHHLTCLRCGTTRDVSLDGDLEERLGELATRAGMRFSFDVDGHRLDLEGLCGGCR